MQNGRNDIKCRDVKNRRLKGIVNLRAEECNVTSRKNKQQQVEYFLAIEVVREFVKAALYCVHSKAPYYFCACIFKIASDGYRL